MDTEDNNHLYYLDDEQKLVKLFDWQTEKCTVDSVIDLSIHPKMEEAIKKFDRNYPWASLLIDNRTLTISNLTVSLTTDFSYYSTREEDESK